MVVICLKYTLWRIAAISCIAYTMLQVANTCAMTNKKTETPFVKPSSTSQVKNESMEIINPKLDVQALWLNSNPGLQGPWIQSSGTPAVQKTGWPYKAFAVDRSLIVLCEPGDEIYGTPRGILLVDSTMPSDIFHNTNNLTPTLTLAKDDGSAGLASAVLTVGTNKYTCYATAIDYSTTYPRETTKLLDCNTSLQMLAQQNWLKITKTPDVLIVPSELFSSETKKKCANGLVKLVIFSYEYFVLNPANN